MISQLLNISLAVLFIPIRLIWTVKIRLGQKVALGCSLCLTLLTIVCTMIKILGVPITGYDPSIDEVWISYWQLIAANIALTMTTATAFRSLYLSRRNDGSPGQPRSTSSFFGRGYRRLRNVLNPRSRPSKDSFHSDESSWHGQPEELPRIEQRAMMTGMRTFIDHQGKTRVGALDSVVDEEKGDPRTLSPMTRSLSPNPLEIAVRHDISTQVESV